MAKATVTPISLTLVLSEFEARTLRDIIQVIGGSPESTRRGTTDGINAALKGVGITRTGMNDTPGIKPPRAIDLDGVLTFN